jgi:chromate reductase, NAD(P)H dehydrogenase (quinone)
MTPRILAFAGSLRKGSWNKKLIRTAVEGARSAGAEVTHIDLAEFPMPVYDGDTEAAEGLPEKARALKALMKSHHGFLIASPEYNSSIPGGLKNAIDWASRREEGEKELECFRGKVAVIMSTSPGQLGGLRALVHVRDILENIGTLVLTEQRAIPKAPEAFDEEGALKDPKQRQQVLDLGKRLAEFLAKMHA